MRAARYHHYGGPEVVHFEEVDKPAVPDDGVLVRVRASSINPADWHTMNGTPLLARPTWGMRAPKDPRLGIDFAGTVEGVGPSVKQLRVGDEVFGGGSGAYAEYVAVPESKSVVLKPANVSFEEAAAVPVAAVTALQGLRDHGHVTAGQKVLINGASGGVGTYAVQIAKSFGAEVTGVCSTQNVEIVRSIGADRVVDYKKDDFTTGSERYDLLLDIAGSRSWSDMRRVLKPDATYVIVGGQKGGPLLGPLTHTIGVRMATMRVSQRLVLFFIAKLNREDMLVLKELLESGKVKSVIDRRYKLDEISDALGYVLDGHARGKVVVTV